RLVQDGALTLGTKIQPILKVAQKNGAPPIDARWNDVTVEHLLTGVSGLNQGLLFGTEGTAQLFGSRPVTPAQLLNYAALFNLTGTPGDKNNAAYGNFDYWVLGELIAKVQGAPSYEAALKQLVLDPLAQRHTHLARSLLADQPPDEARHHMSVYYT